MQTQNKLHMLFNKKSYLSFLFLIFIVAKSQNTYQEFIFQANKELPINQLERNRRTPTSFTPNSNASNYINQPVNLHNGIPGIQIPIYTVRSGDITYPISLKYNAGGIKVSEESGWVGLGWSLDAAGTITQIVNGTDDFSEKISEKTKNYVNGSPKITNLINIGAGAPTSGNVIGNNTGDCESFQDPFFLRCGEGAEPDCSSKHLLTGIGGVLPQRVRERDSNGFPISYWPPEIITGSSQNDPHFPFANALHKSQTFWMEGYSNIVGLGVVHPTYLPRVQTNNPDVNYYSYNVPDFQPDVFVINCNGISGSFTFNQEGEPFLLDNTSNLRIEKEFASGNSGPLNSITVTSGDGVKYKFSETEYTFIDLTRNAHLQSIGDYHILFRSITNGGERTKKSITWLLTEIESPKNHKINFEYDNFYTKTFAQPSVLENENFSAEGFDPFMITPPSSGYYGYCFQHFKYFVGNQQNCGPLSKRCIKSFYVSNATKYLKNIRFNEGIVSFIADIEHTDLEPMPQSNSPKLLSEIQIKNKQNKKLSSFSFEYFTSGVINAPNQIAYGGKTFLKNITEIGKPKTSFFYYNAAGTVSNSQINTPNKTTKALDFWGYYNGIETNTSMLPELYRGLSLVNGTIETHPLVLDYGQNPSWSNKANRNANPAFSRIGALGKIKYPGGATIEYQMGGNIFHNEYKPYSDRDCYLVGDVVPIQHPGYVKIDFLQQGAQRAELPYDYNYNTDRKIKKMDITPYLRFIDNNTTLKINYNFEFRWEPLINLCPTFLDKYILTQNGGSRPKLTFESCNLTNDCRDCFNENHDNSAYGKIIEETTNANGSVTTRNIVNITNDGFLYKAAGNTSYKKNIFGSQINGTPFITFEKGKKYYMEIRGGSFINTYFYFNYNAEVPNEPNLNIKYIKVINNTCNNIGPGLRVDQINFYDEKNNLAKNTKYEYIDGRLLIPIRMHSIERKAPVYGASNGPFTLADFKNLLQSNCSFLNLSGSQNLSFKETSGPVIGYNKVIEYFGEDYLQDINNNESQPQYQTFKGSKGKIEHTFINSPIESWEYNPERIPTNYPLSANLLNGKETNTIEYETAVSLEGRFAPVKKTETTNTYSVLSIGASTPTNEPILSKNNFSTGSKPNWVKYTYSLPNSYPELTIGKGVRFEPTNGTSIYGSNSFYLVENIGTNFFEFKVPSTFMYKSDIVDGLRVEFNPPRITLPEQDLYLKTYDSSNEIVVDGIYYKNRDNKLLPLGLITAGAMNPCTNHTSCPFDVYVYSFFPKRVLLTRTETKLYDKYKPVSENNLPLQPLAVKTTITDFKYGVNNAQNNVTYKATTETTNMQKFNIQRYYYPKNFASEATSPNKTISESLVAKNIVDLPITAIQTKNYFVPKVVSGTIVEDQKEYVIGAFHYDYDANGSPLKNYKTELASPVLFNPTTYVEGNHSDFVLKNENTYDIEQNLISTLQTDNVAMSYIWGERFLASDGATYKYNQVIAQVGGATSTQIAHTSFESGSINSQWIVDNVSIIDTDSKTGKKCFSGSSITLNAMPSCSTNTSQSCKYLVSLWYKGAGTITVTPSVGTAKNKTVNSTTSWKLQEFIVSGSGTFTFTFQSTSATFLVDEVRVHPQDAKMITKTYEPLVGVRDETNAQNVTSYYEYDDLLRIKAIRDLDKKVIKTIKYNIKSND